MAVDPYEPDADEAELRLRELKDELRRYVRAHPFEGLLIAFLSGAVLSLLFRRSP